MAKWVLYAMRYLWETYAQQTDPSMVADKAPDEADYPAYGSKEFVTRAGAELESLTPTDAPRGWDEDEEQGAEDEEQGDEDGEDTEGRDGPVDEDPSVRLSDGGLPNSLECVNAFQLLDFGNSPFKTEMYCMCRRSSWRSGPLSSDAPRRSSSTRFSHRSTGEGGGSAQQSGGKVVCRSSSFA